MKKQKGFTLIELLIVVAIIGILSSIVLAALGNARRRAQFSAAQASMSQVRAQAELDFPGGNYDGLCDTGTGTGDLIDQALSEIGLVYSTSPSTYCNDTVPQFYVVAFENDQGSFCIDSNGYAGVPTPATGFSVSGATSCN